MASATENVASGDKIRRIESANDTSAHDVQRGEQTLTDLLQQHANGQNPNWELLRGLPGTFNSFQTARSDLIKHATGTTSIHLLYLVFC
jgi:hypothetical protein